MKVFKKIKNWIFNEHDDGRPPTRPGRKTVKNYRECQIIKFKKTGELAALIGPWYYNGKWDGSYKVLHSDKRIGYWFPSQFHFIGYTVGDRMEWKEKQNASVQQ